MMPDFVKLELKTLFMAGGIVANVFLLGWMASAYDQRLSEVEKDQFEGEVERKEIIVRLSMIDRIGDDIERIKNDLKELKSRP